MESRIEQAMEEDLAQDDRTHCSMIANRLADLYVSYRGRYTMFRNGTTFIAKVKGEPSKLTDRVLFGHAMREYAIAVFGGAKASKFICFDVDDGNKDTVRSLIAAIEAFGISREMVHVSTSGGKGFHVEIFFAPYAYANRLMDFYKWVIQYGGFDNRYVEFRPSHKQSIKLPLSTHPRTGNICWYLDRETLEPIQSSEYVMGIEKLPVEGFYQLLDMRCGTDQESTGVAHADADVKPVMVSDVLDKSGTTYRPLTDAGQRHNTMVGIAVHQRKAGVGRNECERVLEEWYRCQSTDLIKSQPHEVVRDISNIVAWVYGSKFCARVEQQKQCTMLRRSDIEFVISQKTKSARKLLFLLIARRDAGLTKLSQRRMAEIIRVAPVTVYKLLREFTDNGVIDKAKGKRSLKDGRFTADADACLVNKPGGEKGDMFTTIGMRELMENFTEVYCRSIHELMGGTELSYMTAGERKEYSDYVRNNERGGGLE